MDPEIERLRKKVENYPSPSAYNRLAELLRDNNDPDGVAQVCRRCIREFKRNGKAYIILAEVYLNQGKRNEATTLLEDAVVQDPHSVDALAVLANIHEAKGSPQDAINCLQKILVINPQDAEAQSRIQKLSSGVSQNPVSSPAKTHRHDSGTIDMTGMSLSMTSVDPIPFDPSPRTSAPISNTPVPSVAAASAPTQKPAPAAKPATSSVANPLAPLLNEVGVIGVLIADDQGRIVSVEGITDGKEHYFAALGHEVSGCCEEALGHLKQAPMLSWSITTPNGLLLAFRRNPAFTLLVQASSNSKVAMIELRARQALIDLGGV